MARIRTIKPEFWADEKLAPLDVTTRLVFLGLISMSDDAGRLVDNLKQIDAFIFPETDDSAREALATLSRISRIRRGTTTSGQRIVQIVNWTAHQKIDHPNLKSSLPELIENQESADFRESLANHSRGSREALAPLPVPVPVPVPKKSLLSEADASDDPSRTSLDAALDEVFRYYLTRTERNPKLYEFTAARRNKGRARLRECLRKTGGDINKAVALMKLAIDGLVASDFHMGRDPKTAGKKYCEWDGHLFKNYECMEKWWNAPIDTQREPGAQAAGGAA